MTLDEPSGRETPAVRDDSKPLSVSPGNFKKLGRSPAPRLRPSVSDAPHDPLPAGGERPAFRFKPREFTADNPPVSTPSDTPTDVREHLALTRARPPSTGGTGASLAADNEIHAVLRDNIAHANAAGLNDLKPVGRRHSRRRRDYLLATTLMNGVIAAVACFSPGARLFCLVGAMMFNVSFTWILWFVMDDY